MEIEALIRAIPDFPISGILFRDITPLLKDKQGFRQAIDLFVERFAGRGIDHVVGNRGARVHHRGADRLLDRSRIHPGAQAGKVTVRYNA